MSTQLGVLLKDARKKKNVTLRELGAKIGYTPSFLSEIENGIRPAPKDENIFIKLAEELGLSSNELIATAREERDYRNPKRIMDIFKTDLDLAASFYRASNSLTNDELKDAILKFVQDLEGEK